jgi:hypothetical protein
MRTRNLMLAALVAVLTLSLSQSASATWLSAFVDGGPFDNDGAGDDTTPFVLLDPATGDTGVITTNAVGGTGDLNENATSLGVQGTTNDRFDPTEFWTFEWDQGSEFAHIDFGLYSTAGEQNGFTVQSAAFVGQSITPGSANVTFNSTTGTFTFANGTASDVFNTAALYGAGPIPRIPTGTDVTIAYNAGVGEQAIIEQIGFNIPEPSSAILLAAGACMLIRRRRS